MSWVGQLFLKLGTFFTKYVPHIMPIFEKKSHLKRPVECLNHGIAKAGFQSKKDPKERGYVSKVPFSSDDQKARKTHATSHNF